MFTSVILISRESTVDMVKVDGFTDGTFGLKRDTEEKKKKNRLDDGGGGVYKLVGLVM